MGLVPIKVDPRIFDYRAENKPYTSENSLRFKLHVKCTKKVPGAPVVLNNTEDEEKHYNSPNVYSGDLVWVPIGDQ